jgi:hypothetical protein
MSTCPLPFNAGNREWEKKSGMSKATLRDLLHRSKMDQMTRLMVWESLEKSNHS